MASSSVLPLGVPPSPTVEAVVRVLMEEEMLVGDVISQIAYDPGFDGMGFCTPFVGGGGKNVETARMRKAEFLFLDFTNSLVSGRSSVHARIELFPVVAVAANEVRIGCSIGMEWGGMVFLATFVSSGRRGS